MTTENATPDTPTDAEKLATVRRIVEKARFAMLTTVNEQGALEARPMTPQEVGDDFTVLFITTRSSGPAQQADGKPVNLAFADGMDFVSLSGVGEMRDDLAKKKELWNTADDAFAEGGPENPDNVILAVRCESAQYWDSPAAPVALFGMLKSALGKGDPKIGESGTVEI